MAGSITADMQGSLALQLIQSKGWNWKNSSDPNIEVEVCPYCKKSGYGHFYIEPHGPDSPQANRDGLHTCHRCGKGGSLFSLKQHLGIVTSNMDSRREYSNRERKVEDLPDIEAAHQALLESEVGMNYLMNGRGFSREIIEQQKIGLIPERYFREVGKVPALVYPYLVQGNAVFVRYRTLPDLDKEFKDRTMKAFSSPTGWEVPLYNEQALNDYSLTSIVLVEGEANTIAAMDKGVVDICGVPGANIKKAEWIEKLDKLERIYICYDKDSVGQRAAQELASRIGVEKCWKIILPDFQVTTDDGTLRKGKDLNEWFQQGGGDAEGFAKLKEDAELFDVAGVARTKDAIQEFRDELEGMSGLEPKYKTFWPSLNKLVGFDDGDVIDILAPEKIGKTTFAMNLMEHMVKSYGQDGVFICLEMTRARMARKWIAHKAQIADNIPDPDKPEEGQALRQMFLDAIPDVMAEAGNREGDFYFCYPKYKTVEDIYGLIRDCIRRYGVRWICVDNIQRLCDTTLVGGKNRTEHLSQISKTISQIAKDYNVQLIRILQPHRIQAGKIVTTDNVDGASQIGKDCDCMIALHRERLGTLTEEDLKSNNGFIQNDASFSNNLITMVGLSRYSGGGGCTLHYNGATSTVSEWSAGEIAAMQANSKAKVGIEAISKALGLTHTEAVTTTITAQTGETAL